jgi:hypothetical protein
VRLEHEDEAALCARVWKDLGVASIKMNIMGNRGYPDRLFLLPLRPAWLEFKRYRKGLRMLQAHRIGQLIELGYDAKWTDDYEAAYDWIKALYTARLSEVRDIEDGRAGVRRSVTRSGSREDLN